MHTEMRNENILVHLYSHFYCKCSKISNTFFFMFSNNMVDFRAGIYKMLVRIANREETGQTASSSEAV